MNKSSTNATDAKTNKAEISKTVIQLHLTV